MLREDIDLKRNVRRNFENFLFLTVKENILEKNTVHIMAPCVRIDLVSTYNYCRGVIMDRCWKF